LRNWSERENVENRERVLVGALSFSVVIFAKILTGASGCGIIKRIGKHDLWRGVHDRFFGKKVYKKLGKCP
jgi:hypothetical protein